MSLLSFLHPLWKRSLNEYDDSVNSAVIGALNQSLSKSEEDMVQSKVESYLYTADSKWLDYWGHWFGERRKSGWSDDYYRSRIVNHVEHARGTVDALRDAIADFINTNKNNIYIYEPYRDMFIWNSSKYNTKKYFSSTYYRYAVIDIQISASYPKEIVSIINLFRPAGVLWVLTETVNSRNADAPIIDIKNPKDVFIPKVENNFIFGLRKHTRLVINPSNDRYESVTNPFTYNKKDSLFNDRDSLFMGATQISKRYSSVGQPLFDYTPDSNDTLEDSSYNFEQLSNSDIASVSTKNGRGKTFDFNPDMQNQNMNNWIWSGPAKKAASITYAKGVNTIDYTGVPDYEVFSMPVHAKVGNKVSVTFAYTQPSVVSLDGSSNGVPVSFSDHPSEHTEIGANPLYLGVNAQSSKVYTISTTATSKTMYLSFNFGYLRDRINWKFELSVQQDTPTKLADVIDLKGFINDNYKTLGTTTTNKELNDLFDTKKLHLVIRTVNAPSDSLTIRFFNFNTNLWVAYGKFEIIGSYTDIFVKLDDITPLMNAKSLMYVSMEFSNDKNISVNLDYISLSLSNSEDGYSVKMFADQSPYGIESQSVMGPFTISKSSVSRAYISPSK